MLRRSDVIGVPIFVSGKRTGERIADWILDIKTNQVIGFMVSQGGWAGGSRILLWENVQSIEPHSVESEYRSPVLEMGKILHIKKVLETYVELIGLNVITKQNRPLGEVKDVYFDNQSGAIKGLAMSSDDATFDDFKAYIPVNGPLKVTNGFILITQDMLNATAENGSASTTLDPDLEVEEQIEKAIGNRVQRELRDKEGNIIAAIDQIVTRDVVDTARNTKHEQALLKAVGLLD
jgi:uncharacterized protein YrrD